MSSDDMGNVIVSDLSNEIFCKNPDLDLTPEEIAQCQKYIEIFMPVALKKYFTGFSDYSCYEIFHIC